MYPKTNVLFTSDLWLRALEKYAIDTHLSVKLFDADERVVFGPVHPTPLFQLFEERGYDPGIFTECARRCLAQTDSRPAVMVSEVYGLAAVGASLILEGKIVGAAVAGYAFVDFSQLSEVQRLAKDARIKFERLWEVARAQKPVPQQRLVLNGELLQVLGDALLRENHRTRQYEDAVRKLEEIAKAREQIHQELQQTAAALRENEQRLAQELAATQQLQAASALLIEGGNTTALYQKIGDAAVAIMQSDMASLQMFYPERGRAGELRLLHQRGFSPQAAAFWEWVRMDSESSCAVALRAGQRVIVPDVETCEFMAGSEDLKYYRETGIRAVQSTPLLSRDGHLLGMVSTHWRTPYSPTESQLRIFDVLARQAADLLERNQAVKAMASLAAIVEFSDDAIVSKDLNGIITSWNKGAEHLFGYTPQEAIGQSVTILIPPSRFDEEPSILGRIRRGVSIEHYETVRRRKDGTELNISLTVSPIRDAEGRIVGASKIARDITGRKQAEEALRRAAEFDEAVMANMGEGLYTVDSEGLVTSMNPAAEKLFGWAFAELRGRKMHDLTHHHHADGTPFPAEECAGLEVLKRGKSLIDHEDVFIRKDGTFFNVIFSSSPLKSGDGKILGLVVVFRDITERKRAEADLREAGERFRFLAESMPQKIFTATASGDLDYFNPQWMQFTGLSFEQMKDWGWTQIMHPDDVEENVRRWLHSLATGEQFYFEHRFRRKDGSYRWHLSRAVPFRDADGKVQMWIGSNTDIHDQKEAEMAMVKTEKLAALGRQAATMAHEINNPLEAITNLLYLMKKDGKMSAKSRQRLTLAEEELDRVAHIAKQTLGFYRDNTVPSRLDVSQTIDELLTLYDYRFRNREIKVKKELADSAKIFASAGEFRQVFSNLLVNAVDAISHSEGRIRVRVRASRDWTDTERKGVRITVADNGCGIDANEKDKIFEAFYTTKEEIGIGLGLWLTQDVVKKHNGHIRVRSQVQSGQSGTVFSVFWPEESDATTVKVA